MHQEADKNSMNSCQLIPTHYNMTNIKLKRVEQMNGSMMKDIVTGSDWTQILSI